MAVKLRLMRMGKKKQPTYRVVAADARSPRNGRFIEIIGTYDPRQEPSVVKIDTEKAVDWIRKGAQPTETVARLLKVGRGAARARGSRRPTPTPPHERRRRRPTTRRPTTPTTTPTATTVTPSRPPRPSRCSTCSSPRWSTTPTPSASTRSTQRDRVRLEVRVGPDDMGRVIGKRGRVANAIRTVVRAAAVRDGVDVDIEFED